jgi:uncharacterized protein YjbI with pentapeptide repeats
MPGANLNGADLDFAILNDTDMSGAHLKVPILSAPV